MAADSMITAMGHFLQRLRSDVAGNTLAIVGAALLPITAMIGSGVDVSRAYMAKSRMQSACDAASLAARRVLRTNELGADGRLPAHVIQTGEQFFEFNFQPGMYQTAEFTPEITHPETGVVRVEASTSIPTAVMKLFGFGSLPLSVSCDASLNFVNTDIVLVLDVTGSMLCLPGEASCPGITNERAGSKIITLREAVLALYDELAPVQAQLEDQGLRLRYGFVPYSSTVNVGRLLVDQSADFVAGQVTYQSRSANYNTAQHNANTPTTTSGWEVRSGTHSSSSCSSWVGSSAVNGGGPAPTATTRTTYSGNSSGAGYSASNNWGWSGAPTTTGTNRSCRRWRAIQTTTYTTRYSFTSWTYEPAQLNTSNLKQAGGTIGLANNTAGTVATSGKYNPQSLASSATGVGTRDVAWNGCIEERDTVSGAIGSPPPENAHDLNINFIPNSNQTRWRPMLPEAIFSSQAWAWCTAYNSRGQCTASASSNVLTDVPAASGFGACPSEAARLDTLTREEMDTYLSGLRSVGGTYHDIGMLWGARLISTSGVFGDGCDFFNEMPCNRHVIFMTDGAQTAYCNVYSAYGLERLDRRVLNNTNCTSDDQNNATTKLLLARHQERFQAICDSTRNQNASIWVIAFDTALTDDLSACADNDNQASTSGNREQLIARFREIGNQIGALRLTR